MKSYATITLIGRDRSGVIARVTQLLFQNGANVEALEEQVSRGQFSMTLQASCKKDAPGIAVIRKQLPLLAQELNMKLTVHLLDRNSKPRMALFVTKESHAPEAILKSIASGKLKAVPAVILSNRSDLKPLAQKAKIPFHLINFQDRLKAEEEVSTILHDHHVNFIVLARFMKILSPNFVWQWKNKILNIHPSLLPAFPGASAYRQAYEKGVKILGVTAHFVTPDLDQGPIIAQDSFKVKPGESLASMIKRGQELESKTLLRAIQLFIKNRLDVYWGKVYGV